MFNIKNKISIILSVIGLIMLFFPIYKEIDSLNSNSLSIYNNSPFVSYIMIFFFIGMVLISLFEKTLDGLFALSFLSLVSFMTLSNTIIHRTNYGFVDIFNNNSIIFILLLLILMTIGLIDFFKNRKKIRVIKF